MEPWNLGRTAARFFVAGIALCAGAAVVFAGVVWVVNPALHAWIESRKSSEFTPNAGQLVVEKLEPFAVTRAAGVQAVIRNRGTQSSQADRVTLTITQGSKVLFVCKVHADAFIKPGESVTEQLLCPEVERASLPTGATYSLNIAGAWNSR